MSTASHLCRILCYAAAILSAAGTIPSSLAGLANALRSFDGLVAVARRVVPLFDGKPIVREGIASTPSSITALKAPKHDIPIAHLPHQIVLQV